MKYPITTTVDQEDINERQKSGLQWNQIIKRGIQSLKDENAYKSEFLRLREDNARLSTRIQELAGKVYMLQNPKVE